MKIFIQEPSRERIGPLTEWIGLFYTLSSSVFRNREPMRNSTDLEQERCLT